MKTRIIPTRADSRWRRGVPRQHYPPAHGGAHPYNSTRTSPAPPAAAKFTLPNPWKSLPRADSDPSKVRHPKYGEGTVYQREGEGEEAKITVQFPRFGLKKLVEKYAQLERA
jgi:hypothetical protein